MSNVGKNKIYRELSTIPSHLHQLISIEAYQPPEEVNNQRDESEWEEEDINFDPLIIICI